VMVKKGERARVFRVCKWEVLVELSIPVGLGLGLIAWHSLATTYPMKPIFGLVESPHQAL
jgi:hypothetical protein